MQTTRCAVVLICVLCSGRDFIAVAAQQPKYGVTVKVSKPDALAKAHTYSWTASQPAHDKSVDKMIVAAVDRELQARNLTRATSGPGDLVATYASLGRTDVDLKSKGVKTGAGRQLSVGTLVVDLRDPATRQPLFRVRIDTPIDTEPDKIETSINAAVTAMFEIYPVPGETKR